MKKAIILYGPSGVGKSTLANKISKNSNFKHCTADEFKFIFSKKRSNLRSELGEILAYHYAKELIKRDFNIILEAIPDNYLKNLKRLLNKQKYKIIEISLIARLEKCLKNDMMKKDKKYGPKIIKEVYEKLCFKRGDVINVEDKNLHQIFKEVKKKYL